MLKLIATDMDGTWLNDQKDFDHQLFKKIMAVLRKRNINFVVASGNEFENLRTRFPECADELYYVAENGSLVAHGRQVLHVTPIPPKSMNNIMQIEQKYNNFSYLFAGVVSAYVRKSDGEAYFQDNKKYFSKIERVDNFKDIIKRDRILEVGCRVGRKNLANYLARFREKFPENEFVSGSPVSIDIQGKGMNKAVGLRYLSKRLNISPREMIAFGDSGNDEAMLRYVGHSYATAYALPSAKKAADEIIGSSNDSAVQLKVLQILKNM